MAWLLLVLVAVTARDAAASPPLSDLVRIAPGPDGALGAWLVIGPFHAASGARSALTRPPPGTDERTHSPREGDDWGRAAS
ncbi:MAG: hypothetical protein ACRELY_30285, partial [Polyangiaceae bacterium]